MEPTERALRLLALLQGEGGRDADELARGLGVTTRTVRRDVSRLRRLGYAVRAVPGPGSRYRLVPGTRVPPLLLEADEVTALVTGLRLLRSGLPDDDAAERALVKLEQVLPPSLRRRAAATDSATEVLLPGARGVTTARLGVLADAVAQEGRVRFTYRDALGCTTPRLVDPLRQVQRGGTWYLVGHDVDRGELRTFRADRVQDLVPVPGHHTHRRALEGSLEAWFAADFGRAAARVGQDVLDPRADPGPRADRPPEEMP